MRDRNDFVEGLLMLKDEYILQWKLILHSLWICNCK